MSESEATVETGGEASEKHVFQAEISRLLKLLIHSVYSEKDVFLRELISNASDACDKLRYLALTSPDLTGGDTDLRIELRVDPNARILTVADNGIGMDRDDLVTNLGTIARSGTDAFLGALSDDGAKDVSLIGKFGVGFYAAFMVADKVQVLSRKAGEEGVWLWESDGMGAFTVTPSSDDGQLLSGRGTAIRLHLRAGEETYVDAGTLRRVVKTYSDHVSFPISLRTPEEDAGSEPSEDTAADDETGPGEATEEILNDGKALWTRPKSDITEEQYAEFYRHVSHGFDAPWKTIHYRAEGRHEFTALLFVPSMQPFDLFEAERKGKLKLYVNRVFITAEAPFLPPYLRFVRGVVDSSDIPLTISREMLQNNPLVSAIGSSLTKKVLGELKTCAEKEPERYVEFWGTFGQVLKEGLYEDRERQESLLELVRFKTTRSGEGFRSLKEYLADLQDNQTAIYYITGESADAVATSPQLEGFKARNIEVLLLSDPVDAFWVGMVPGFEGKPFKSVTRGAADLETVGTKTEDASEADAQTDDTAMGVLIAGFKQALGEAVTDVRRSERLTTSAVCLVAEDNGLDMHIEKLLRSQDPSRPLPGTGRVLEINPKHGLIASLAARAKNGIDGRIEDAAHLLLDQARIQQGETVSDPAAFARRLQTVMADAVGTPS
ncbi:MAG: molecular chaperone HtpG [Alphaproteobacteria bacterium]